jgi:hypothetical protein
VSSFDLVISGSTYVLKALAFATVVVILFLRISEEAILERRALR